MIGIDFRSTVPIHLTCKTSVGRKNHEIMQVMFYVIFQPYYCTAVKTVKCTIQRTSSADTLRKPRRMGEFKEYEHVAGPGGKL